MKHSVQFVQWPKSFFSGVTSGVTAGVTGIAGAIAAGLLCLSAMPAQAESLAELKTELLKAEVATAVAEFKHRDPSLETFFNNAAGYVVFPGIVKAGFIIGGAHGKGRVFKAQQYIGDASVTQATVGLQAGGASYREIIFFQEPWRLNQFMNGNFAFSASASAVAVTAGAAKTARYNRGVAVFTLAKGGLMLEASVGGQKFGFKPKPEAPAETKETAAQPVIPSAVPQATQTVTPVVETEPVSPPLSGQPEA